MLVKRKSPATDVLVATSIIATEPSMNMIITMMSNIIIGMDVNMTWTRPQ